MRTWSRDALARAESWLQQNPPLPCRCGSSQFTLDSNLAAVPVMPPEAGDGSIKVGPVFALLYLECAQCHEVRMYNAKGVGVID